MASGTIEICILIVRAEAVITVNIGVVEGGRGFHLEGDGPRGFGGGCGGV